MSNETSKEEKKKRIILIGRSTAGKTTLCQRINNEELHYYKTQTVQVINKNMIDTPREYLERRGFRGALIVTSADADIILMVQDATEGGTMFPPLFCSMFSGKPCVGIVERAKQYLKDAGAGELYVTSAVTGDGVNKLVEDLHIL